MISQEKKWKIWTKKRKITEIFRTDLKQINQHDQVLSLKGVADYIKLNVIGIVLHNNMRKYEESISKIQ